MGFRSPPKRNPASFQAATGTRSRAPRPNLSPRARAPRPPLSPPGPHSPRVPLPSPRGCRSPHSGPPGHPQELSCSAGPAGAGQAQGAAPAAMASSRALAAARGPVLLPGRAGGGCGGGGGGCSGSSLGRGRGRAWGGKWEARRALPGGASAPTGGAGMISRPPAARGWRVQALRVVSASGPRMFEAGIRGSERSRLGLRGSERRWFALAPGRPRPSRWHLRVVRTVRSGLPTRDPRGGVGPGLPGPRAPPAASTPRAVRLNAAPSGDTPRGLVLGCTGQHYDRCVFFLFFLSIVKELGVFLLPPGTGKMTQALFL